jgi:predicted alpha-1,6-mannanase (GH76 family)
MGAAINGRSLNDLGSMVRNVKKSLKLTATALAKGKPVSPEAVDLMAKQFISSWIYMQIGGIRWRRQTKKNKVRTKSIYNRPYQR